jgi:hypothetical protein
MINNTNLDRKRLMLTANHCLNGGGQSFVDTWVYIFNYEAPACVNPTTEPSRSQSVAGGILRANHSGSDMALIELTSNIPTSYNIYFNGWDRNIAAPTQSVGIHHPDGDIKKISIDQQAAVRVVSYVDNSPSDAGSHLLVYWDQNTVTEGGSSGSPLFDQNKRIVGQLHGGASGCGEPSANMWDLYGRIYTSWTGGGSNSSRLSNWLDPTNSGVFSLNGLEGVNPNAITQENIWNEYIKIYPNPVKDIVNINFEGQNIGNQLTLKVSSMEGKEIESHLIDLSPNQNSYQFKINNLPKGIYLFQFSNEKGKGVKKVVIE